MDAIATRGRGRPPGVNRMELSARQSEALAFVDSLRERAFRIGEAVYVGNVDRALDLCGELQSDAALYARKWTDLP